MSSRYQRVPTSEDPLSVNRTNDNDNDDSPNSPPSFTSTTSPSTNIPRSNNPPVYSAQRQRTDLEETFGENLDDDEADSNESHRLLRTTPAAAPAPSTPSSSNITRNSSRPAILPVTNDGVFSNMAAKPDTEANKLEETPPAYEEAAADSTPPYWQTTIIAPAGMGDIILVEGMPVGNLFNFAWNLLVSASFQFVGFMLTYLLHTSHAAKQGSRTGLGITLVQFGFYIRSRGSLDDFEFDDGNDDSNDKGDKDSTNADIIAYILMLLGWFIIIRSIADYVRARKMEKIIAAEPTPESIV